MNHEQREALRSSDERAIFLSACRLDEFSVTELWEYMNRWHRYGYISSILRSWWILGYLLRKDRDGTWVPFNSGYNRFGVGSSRLNNPLWQGKAVYMWVD